MVDGAVKRWKRQDSVIDKRYNRYMHDRRLSRRPEARVFSVEDLLDHLRRGRIRIPFFQRGLKWKGRDVLDLFDSIYRGFPVGELLFWKRPADEEDVRFGATSFAVEAVPDALFVVDGQQRLTALAGALLHPNEEPRGDLHAVWFDLVSNDFVRLSRGEPERQWIPLNVLLDSTKLLQWLDRWPCRKDNHDLLTKAFEVGKAVREYRIPAYIVEESSVDVLKTIFARVNTSGVRMTEHEVFDALSGREKVAPVERACTELEDTGFGRIDAEWFLRCVKSVTDQEPDEEVDETRVLSESVEEVNDTREALRRAIEFLQTDAGFPHAKFMPYRLPLVVLTRFFHLHSKPHSRSRVLLSRWVWRGALARVHGDSSYSSVRRWAHDIDDDEHESVQRLLRRQNRKPTPYPSPSTKWTSRADSSLAATAMIHLEPIDPSTGQAFGWDYFQDRLNSEDTTLRGLCHDLERRPRGPMARHAFLPNREAIHALAATDDEAILASHGMNDEARRALAEGDIQSLVALRSEILGEHFRSFFDGRAGVHENDRLPISTIVDNIDRVFET